MRTSLDNLAGRVSLVLIGVLLGSLATFVQPAWACGCGAMVANDTLRVDDEASIVRWDGTTEQIVMRLAVDTSATNAAWILPTPSAASVKLGDRRWFGQIAELTKPSVEVDTDWWPRWHARGYYGATAGAPPAGPVQVLSQQRLGSLDVATLDASDAGALSAWLTAHGYELRPELAQTLQIYVKKHWKYVAVRLSPQAQAAQQALRGELDPLQVSFAATELIYPMAASRLAKSRQHVRIWVIAPHRMKRVDTDVGLFADPVLFAGRVSGVSGSLGRFIGNGQWVTELDALIYRPEQIRTDWTFAADKDTAYRDAYTRYDPVYILGIPGGWFVVGLVGLVLTLIISAGTLALALRRSRAVPGGDTPIVSR